MVARLVFGRALRDELALTWAVFGLGVVGIMVAVQVRGAGPLRADSSAITLMLLGAMIALGHCFTLTIVLRLAARAVTGRLLALFDLPLRAVLVLLIAASAGQWSAPVPAAALALGAAVLLIIAGLVAHGVRVRRSAFNYFTGFVQDINQFYARWMFGVQRIGRCTVPAEGPVIVAANHTASIDPNLIGATCPQRMIGYVIAREYANFPFVRWVIRGIECVPVRRGSGDAGAVRAALRHLEQGKVLGIFPQGTIEKPGEPLGPHTGVALLALRSGATVIPVHISGTRWSKSIVRPFVRRHEARVRYGRPVDLSAYAGRERDRETLREAAELIMAKIRELGERSM